MANTQKHCAGNKHLFKFIGFAAMKKKKKSNKKWKIKNNKRQPLSWFFNEAKRN